MDATSRHPKDVVEQPPWLQPLHNARTSDEQQALEDAVTAKVLPQAWGAVTGWPTGSSEWAFPGYR